MLQDVTEQPHVAVPTPFGMLKVRVVRVNGKELLVATSEVVPAVPIVRFQSSCVFGEAFQAVDCDCGAQLTAALKLIGAQGGVLVYAWEEGRGVGIVDKVKAIAMQQTKGLPTSDAFRALGHDPDPRTFDAHIEALRTVVTSGLIHLASGNPRKIHALEAAGYTVERIKLEVEDARTRSLPETQEGLPGPYP